MFFNVTHVEVESRLLIDTRLLLDVVILEWSDIVLCEEESGFPHKETSCDIFKSLYQRSRKPPGHKDGSEVPNEEQMFMHLQDLGSFQWRTL